MQKGKTLLEMIGVLAIIGVLSIMAFKGISSAMAKIGANHLVEDFLNASFTLESSDIIYKAALNDTKPVDSSLIAQESNILLTYTRTGNQRFDVIANNLPEGICKKMIDAALPSAYARTVNGQPFISASQCQATNTLAYTFTIPLKDNPKPEDAGEEAAAQPCNGACQGCEVCNEALNMCEDSNTKCASGFLCSGGECVCPAILINIDGVCRNCDDSENWNISTEAECLKCPKRAWFNGVCYPECQAGYYRNDAGVCRECAGTLFKSTSSEAECNRCPNRVFELQANGVGACHKPCTGSTPIAGTSACTACNASKTYIEVMTEAECNKCGSDWFYRLIQSENRAVCYSPCKEGQVRGTYGSCTACDTAKTYIEVMTEAECNKCGSDWFYHYIGNENRAVCYSPCSEGQVRDMYGRCVTCGEIMSSAVNEDICSLCGNDTNFWDNQYNTCRSCSDPAGRNSTVEECHRCSNRFLMSGTCQRCSTTSNFYDKDGAEECARCPNRVFIKNYCYKPSGEGDGYIRSENNGACYSCTEANTFKTIASECAKCTERVYNSSTRECSLK